MNSSKSASTASATSATLAEWQAREAEIDARATVFGVTPPQQLAARSGLETMAALLSGELPAAPIAGTLDFALVVAEHGRAEFQGRPGPGHLNPLGTVHGGWTATLLDSALGCAVHTTLAAGKAYTTLELKVNYVKALTPRTGLVRAVGEVISVGARVATAQARLVGPDGTLYAHGTTTCLIFDAAATKG